MNVEQYLNTVESVLHAFIEKVIFSETRDPNWIAINQGIGTMFRIIQSILIHNPKITKKECISLCKKFMRELSIQELITTD